MGKVIPVSFFSSDDVVAISKNLLGKFIVTKFKGITCVGKIVETEAYRAPDDKACHAYKNKRTPRTETMFSEGGTAYVYVCYGIHNLFNIVTAPKGMAHAVLIRGIEPIEGIDQMLERRKFDSLTPALTNGPGKLTVALGIKRIHNGVSLDGRYGDIWMEDRGEIILKNQIIEGPRVGMSTAEECAHWLWRFRIKELKLQ